MEYYKGFILIVIAILITISSNAGSCPGQKWANWSIATVQNEIKDSEVIFLSEVIASDGFNYSMKVIDIFKGKVEADTIFGSYKHKCYLAPKEGMWIVYSKLENTPKGLQLKDLSSLSRSLSHPLSNNIPEYPAPPTSEVRADSAAMVEYHEKLDEFILEKEREMLPVFLKNWMCEYAMLLAYRRNESNPVASQPSSSNAISYIALGFAFLALVIAFKRKKK